MDIKILGTGCKKCQQLETLTRHAVAELELDADIDKITDPAEIAAWGVMSTPALAGEGSMYVLMFLVLLLRPRGLLGEPIEKFEK